MATRSAGPPVGRAVGRRPVLLSGGLLLAGGLVDVLTALPSTAHDRYLVMTDRGLYLVDLTGWEWLHVAVGTTVAVAGLLVLLDRPWAAPLGIASAALAIAVDTLAFAYQPARAALLIPVSAAVIWLLVRHRWRSRTSAGVSRGHDRDQPS